MKKIILPLFLILIFLVGCETVPETENTSEYTVSQCDTYSEGPRKIMCYAIEAEDITMCDEVIGLFRDSCFVALAEIVYDTSLVGQCDLVKAEGNRKICVGLMTEDIDKCFDWGQGEGLGVSLSVRDCIDLTSRKMRDVTMCEVFSTRQSDLMNICGDTGDCEGQWIYGIDEHVEDCKYAVEEAIGYDAEN